MPAETENRVNLTACHNCFLFSLEVLKNVGNCLLSFLVLFSMEETLLNDMYLILNYPFDLIGSMGEFFVSLLICFVFGVERKFFLSKFVSAGVSEKFCKAIKIFSVISVITTLEYFLTIVILGNQ